jgi:cell division protein FtsL
MTTEETPKEAIKENPQGKDKSRTSSLRSVLGGSLLASEKVLKHLPFVFFLVFLGILLIANRYWSQRTIRQMEAVQDSIKELKAEAVTFETELMKINRPSEIAKRVKESGLELFEPQLPARKLKVKKLEPE